MEQTSTSMDCAPLNAPSALGLENTGVDKNVKFSDGQKGLLVCQIGYALPGVRVAYLVAPEKATLDAISAFTVVNEEGSVILAGKPMYSGEWVTAHFSTLDLSGIRTPGRYRVVAGGLVSNLFPVTTPNGLFFAPHYQGMMIGQMRIRKRTDERGGYIDCGNDIRETNSHATQLRGIMDMLDLHPELLGTEEKSEIEAILAHLEAFFLNQQMETGIILGGWWGDQRIENMGQWPNHLRGVYSLLRLARYFETTNPEESRKLLAAVKRGMEYSLMNSETEKTSSTLLTMHLWNEAEYHRQTGDSEALKRAKHIARELRERQLKPTESTPAGLYGLFREERQKESLSRLNYHVADSPLNGEFWGLPLHGLLLLLEIYPNDPAAAEWRATLCDFVEGFIKKGCMLSPMKLIPNGEYQGVRWFSDLFHGQSMTYGLMASDMIRYGQFLGDTSLIDLAEHQLLWVGGLNTGADFPGDPNPFSCIVGKGYQWLGDGHGQFTGITGSIVNGLSATEQFKMRMPAGSEQPKYLCNESWIAHTGGWLSGTAYLLRARAK